ncbi:MAG TPA: SCO family protein [Lacipirellulaceae bacterium]|jgi:protein SCO1/2|nr:SCO family protein [Lacipirellulaceae bacterium]
MQRRRSDSWFKRFPRIVVAIAAFLFAQRAMPCHADDTPIAQVAERIRISPPLGAKLPLDLSFIDAAGHTARLGDSLGKRPVILHLVYYECPMLCKLSSDGLLSALSTLSLKPGKDFSIVTVSFDPREGPELSARAREMAIERSGREAVDQGWQFFTGDQATIDKLCESVRFRYVYDEKTGQFAHASGVFILTPEGTLSSYLSGVQFSPRDLRLALVEASAGKVGSAVDQVMLMCYMYDPITGKYGLAIMSTLRAAGVATVGALGIGIFVMLRRERRRSGLPPDANAIMSG